MRCETCKFFQRRIVQSKDRDGKWITRPTNDGECHRHAPAPFVDHESMKEQILWPAVWPTVKQDDFCGEHVPKDTTPTEEQSR